MSAKACRLTKSFCNHSLGPRDRSAINFPGCPHFGTRRNRGDRIHFNPQAGRDRKKLQKTKDTQAKAPAPPKKSSACKGWWGRRFRLSFRPAVLSLIPRGRACLPLLYPQ